MKRHGLAGLLVLLLAAPPAFPQASNLANCKYYTKVQQDFEQGLPYCAEAIKENPNDPEARFFGAWCLAESGRYSEAWESFSWLMEHRNEDKKIKKHAKMADKRVQAYYATFFNEGIQVLQAEDYEGARDLFRKATEIDPRKTDAYLNLGYTLSQLDDEDAALKAFATAVEHDPENKVAREYYWHALIPKLRALRAESPPDEAAIAEVSAVLRETLEKLLTMEPEPSEAADVHLDLGDLELAEGNDDAAMAHMRQAIELAPDSVVNLANIGIEFYKQNDYASSIDALETVLEYATDPSDEVWRMSVWVLGNSFYEAEKYDEALTQFEKLLDQDPENLEYLPKAGLAARKAGQQELGDKYLIQWEELKEKQVTGE
jgi:tetratricopeptide (TPR) repeat protein